MLESQKNLMHQFLVKLKKLIVGPILPKNPSIRFFPEKSSDLF